MLCYGHKKERDQTPDVAASPRRQNSAYGTNNAASIRPKEPPSMVIQGDFRKVSGISNEIFRQIETIENEYDASTAAALEAVERRGEMIVRILDPKHLGKAAAEAAKKFISLQDSKHTVFLVEIIKRPGQTLGLYIREGNGLDRGDGVFISRIALESSVYNSGCIQVGDEILAVNLVDVTHMSIDDVVIIMSIPRRLVLATRHFKGYPSNATNSSHYGTLSHVRPPEPKPPPVVVLKKDFSKDEEFDDDEDDRHFGSTHFRNNTRTVSSAHEKPRSQFALDSNGDIGTDMYYNSRPESRRHHQTSTLDRRIGGWTYTPQPGILEHHLKQVGSYQSNFDRNHTKTLESLAEKVHSFCPSGSTLGRRTSDTTLSTRQTLNQRMVRSGSDQHLPRVEYEDFSHKLPTRQSQTLLRSGFRSGATTPSYNRQFSAGNSLSSCNSSLSKRLNVDYASDTEASYPTTPKSSSHYYYQLPSTHAVSGMRMPTLNNFTSDEYRAWLSRTPSTSAIYDQLKSNGENSLLRQRSRFTFSAENLPERTRQAELWYGSKYRMNQLALIGPVNVTPLPSATVTTLDRHTRTSSLRRIKNLQKLEAKHLGNQAVSPDVQIDRNRVLEINTSEFNKYKLEKNHVSDEYASVNGLLWIHLLGARGLRIVSANTPLAGANTAPKDLYCVLECDRIHKARTVVRSGDLVFDWDETFELDLFGNRELDFLVYSWDPQYRHKLFYKGSIHLSSLLSKSPIHQLALKVEPRGTLYVRLRHTSAFHTYLRKPSRPLLPSRNLANMSNLFGADLESIVSKECESVSSSLQSLPVETPLAISVPVIVRRCVEEIERRGLEIVGVYRLCGSATKKRILREAFERNPRMIDLSPDNVPDINVITGVFKDYLRELPEPLFTKHLYHMIVDALSVCMSDDPQGNAKLIFSLLDCLSRGNKATLIFVMDHLSLVISQSTTNKMSSQNLSIIFAPLLMIKSESEDKEIDFNQPINILRYLLDVWPSKLDLSGIAFFQTVREMATGAGKTLSVRMDRPPPLPKKPNSVSAQGGSPPPIPLKGIRKPQPVISACVIQAAAASLTTENNGPTISTSKSNGTEVTMLVNGTHKDNSNREATKEIPLARSWSNQGLDRRMFNQNGVQSESHNSSSRNQQETYSNVSSSLSTPWSSASGTLGRSSQPANGMYTSQGARYVDNTVVGNHIGKPSDAYGFRTIGCGKSNNVSSRVEVDAAKWTKVEQALEQMSNSSKAMSTAFGHSCVDGNLYNLTKSGAKVDSSRWEGIVESWIKENGDSSSSTDSVLDTHAYRQSHNNPFLVDLNPDHGIKTTCSKESAFSNGFKFFNSPSTVDSKDSVTVLDVKKGTKTSTREVSATSNLLICSPSVHAVATKNGFHKDENIFRGVDQRNKQL